MTLLPLFSFAVGIMLFAAKPARSSRDLAPTATACATTAAAVAAVAAIAAVRLTCVHIRSDCAVFLPPYWNIAVLQRGILRCVNRLG